MLREKYLIYLSLSAAFILLIVGLACDSLTVEKYHAHGLVATSSPIATAVGLEVLKDGGNAFDASVAIGFALAVCYPRAGNVGGGGFALFYSAETGEVSALDFRETAPAKADREMYLDKNGGVVPNASLIGAKAAGVPGTVAGLHEISKRYGSLEWYTLLEPAIKLADTGFIVSDCMEQTLARLSDKLSVFPETRAVFVRNGTTPRSGERFIQKELAATLERIAMDSTDGFYTSETADLIVGCMEKNSGLISHDDLSGYRVKWRRPIHFTFDSLDVYSMPPPSSGGVILGQILKLIEPYDFYKYSPDSPDYIHLFAEVCRLAYADRAVHLGDPDFAQNPLNELLDSAYLDSRRQVINLEAAGNSREIGSGLPEQTEESESTTHFVVADEAGNIVSLSYTINDDYGSKLVVDGAGFLLNNEMDDFAVKPGVPNLYGLVGGKANEIAPAKRMLSSMSPTIVMKKGRPVLALGSAGGSKIITTVAEAIISLARFDLSLKKAIEHPRFHHQWLPDTLYLERGGFDINIMQDLISKGHIVKERDRYSDLNALRIDDNSLMTGASDSRRCGKADGY
ncbi:MAG: gamma-glutamyltransferase [Candidatus Zixiibacteriota bacterium]|nr:MAG: gamma-glutamyltransferase [candidate division Zixibacteria bacterium]